MKKRLRGNKREMGFEELARLIKLESEDIRSELQDFREETSKNFKELREEIRDIKHRLEALEEKVGNMLGYSKEIDHLLARVARIENHLGLASK